MDFNDTHELEILPIKPPEITKKMRTIHPNLPDVSRGVLLVNIAPILGGKSTKASNLLLRNSMFYGCFPDNNVTIISPTISHDQSGRFLYKLYKDNCFSNYTDRIIKGVIDYQTSHEDGKKPAFCLYADDTIGEISKYGNSFNNFCSKFRHYSDEGSLVMINSQKFREVSPIIRANANVYFLGKIYNRKERGAILEELADSFGGSKIFEQKWNEATADPYGFLYVNLSRGELFKNLTTKIYP